MGETLYLVDGSSVLFRAFFAIRNLSTRDGRPTNAIYGTLKIAEKILKEHKPTHIAFVFDLPAPTFRHEAYALYKANRPEAPSDLVAQIEPAKDMLRAMGLPILEMAGYEADDIIGTLTLQARRDGFSVIIATADKDLFQLVQEGVAILYTKDESILDAKGVEEKFGVRPDQVPDVLALWGDASDNIPGVPGIGEKGAKELIRRFGDLESVLSHANEVERKAYREGLLNNPKDARFSRELATVKCDMSLPWAPSGLRLSPPERERLQALFRTYEFSSLILEGPGGKDETVLSGETRPFDDEALAALKNASAAGLAWDDATLWFSDGQMAWDLPVSSLSPDLFHSLPVCAHDLKPLLRKLGPSLFIPAPSFLDAAVAGYMLDPSARVPTVSSLASALLNLSVDEAAGPARAMALARLKKPLEERLGSLGMKGLWSEIEGPLVGALARLEAAGIGVDMAYFGELSPRMAGDISALESRIHELCGVTFNVQSPKQLGEVLFEKLRLAVQKKTAKTKSYSTDNEVLEKLRDDHPVIPLILEYRMLSKLKGTYLDPLQGWVDPSDGRIHARFNQTVAATGRLSSSEPNLQNIPMKGEWGPRIRHGFAAAPGHLFVGADYSQIELRMLAHLSGDQGLAGVFASGQDIHTATAAEIFGVSEALVTSDMRRGAKAVNFGIIYGLGAFGLARDIGVSRSEAAAFIGRYFARFPSVRAYIESVEKSVMEKEEVVTILGRRRLFAGIARAAKPLQQALLRQAVNTAIQGSAADLIKKAMVDVEPALPKEAKLVLQVHDELVIEAPEPLAAKAASILKDAMEQAMKLSVPIVASVSQGKRWDELK